MMSEILRKQIYVMDLNMLIFKDIHFIDISCLSVCFVFLRFLCILKILQGKTFQLMTKVNND